MRRALVDERCHREVVVAVEREELHGLARVGQ
jgi:hypothetical protein